MLPQKTSLIIAAELDSAHKKPSIEIVAKGGKLHPFQGLEDPLDSLTFDKRAREVRSTFTQSSAQNALTMYSAKNE